MASVGPEFCCNFERFRAELQSEACEPAHLLDVEVGYDKPGTVTIQHRLELCRLKQRAGICKRPDALSTSIKAAEKYLQEKGR